MDTERQRWTERDRDRERQGERPSTKRQRPLTAQKPEIPELTGRMRQRQTDRLSEDRGRETDVGRNGSRETERKGGPL